MSWAAAYFTNPKTFARKDTLSDQSQISKDAQYLKLSNELRDLRQQQQKTRPAVYLLAAIIFGIVGLFLPIGIAVFVWLFALAALLATITAVVNRSSLSSQIARVEVQIMAFANASSQQSYVSKPMGITNKLTELQGLLDRKLITQEEYDTKKAELLKQI